MAIQKTTKRECFDKAVKISRNIQKIENLLLHNEKLREDNERLVGEIQKLKHDLKSPLVLEKGTFKKFIANNIQYYLINDAYGNVKVSDERSK